ncbi:hypothetical protein [Hymenobacter aerophilus]|uniref:hypothetical protein n=1 Tax=Hymenobacter aerophilus TaxID=119644 RepID=UPI00037B483B|nr:hypothetical protein [Hymenobacter aerophilus]
MKLNFLLAAALCVGTATAASAQTTPTGTPRSGTMNQTTPMTPNPASPTTNPGTIDQRTPTMSNPTNVGTMDRTPAVESRTTMEAERRTSTMTTTEPRRTRTTTTKRSTRKANMPRSTSPIK